MWWLAWIGCGRGAGRIETAPVQVHVGQGWAVGVPAGAKIEVQPDVVRVDSADGTSWFDVRWIDGPADGTAAEIWARASCTPPVWDEPWISGGRWTAGGICVIGQHRWWMIHVLEPIGEHTLHTAFLADSKWIAYEDAWVLASHTALGFAGGDHPLAPPDPEDLRTRLRQAAALPPGPMPVAGGGVLSTHVLPLLGDIWAARDRAPPPFPLRSP
jgi:hypothetical protein